MPPRGVKSPKRKRQYAKVLRSIGKSRRYGGRKKDVAARIVNKTRARKGETKAKSRRPASSRSKAGTRAIARGTKARSSQRAPSSRSRARR